MDQIIGVLIAGLILAVIIGTLLKGAVRVVSFGILAALAVLTLAMVTGRISAPFFGSTIRGDSPSSSQDFNTPSDTNNDGVIDQGETTASPGTPSPDSGLSQEGSQEGVPNDTGTTQPPTSQPSGTGQEPVNALW